MSPPVPLELEARGLEVDLLAQIPTPSSESARKRRCVDHCAANPVRGTYKHSSLTTGFPRCRGGKVALQSTYRCLDLDIVGGVDLQTIERDGFRGCIYGVATVEGRIDRVHGDKDDWVHMLRILKIDLQASRPCG